MTEVGRPKIAGNKLTMLVAEVYSYNPVASHSLLVQLSLEPRQVKELV